jgi:hypothetical protein
VVAPHGRRAWRVRRSQRPLALGKHCYRRQPVLTTHGVLCSR